MPLILPLRGFTPQIGRDCFLAENATVVGDVIMGDECSIWFNTVLRGDVNSIRIGNRVNIQDGSVLHTLYQKSTIEIGNDVSIGHNVTVHGAKIHDYALIGMGAIVMDDAEVGEGAPVGRLPGQIHQDDGTGEIARAEPEDSPQLSFLLPLVHPPR